MTRMPGLFVVVIVHRPEQQFISFPPCRSLGIWSTPGSGCRHQVFSWSPILCLWVSVWHGWAQWCPGLLDPGPSPGSSPCSATSDSPCLSRGSETHSPLPLLRGRRSRGALLFASAWHPRCTESRGARWFVCWLFSRSSFSDALGLTAGPNAAVRALSSSPS